MARKLSFTAGCLLELVLLVFAFVWCWLLHQSALGDIHWSFTSALVGILASVPPLGFFLWTLNSRLHVWTQHKQLMEGLIRPLLGNWSLWQLFIISLAAGLSEEAFFRGAIQGSLADRMNVIWAVVLASGLFGAAHLLTWTYALFAALIGVYLGLLWIWTGNLLTPCLLYTSPSPRD